METLLRLTNKHELFYRLIGPYLSRRDIVKALGEPVWDDDQKEWFVGLQPCGDPWPGDVVGFATVRPTKGGVAFADSYVRPEFRGQGIWTALNAARLEAYPSARISVVTSPKRKTWAALGFTVDRSTKNYLFMHRDAS